MPPKKLRHILPSSLSCVHDDDDDDCNDGDVQYVNASRLMRRLFLFFYLLVSSFAPGRNLFVDLLSVAAPVVVAIFCCCCCCFPFLCMCVCGENSRSRDSGSQAQSVTATAPRPADRIIIIIILLCVRLPFTYLYVFIFFFLLGLAWCCCFIAVFYQDSFGAWWCANGVFMTE